MGIIDHFINKTGMDLYRQCLSCRLFWTKDWTCRFYWFVDDCLI